MQSYHHHCFAAMQNGSVVLEEDFEVSVLPWKNQGDQNKKSKAKAKPRVIRPAIKTEELEDYLKERSENNFEELRKEYKVGASIIYLSCSFN